MASSSSDHLRLVAAALTHLTPGTKVITKKDPVYKTLKNPKPFTYEILSKNAIVESRPEPDPGLVLALADPETKIIDNTEAIGDGYRIIHPIVTRVGYNTITVEFMNGKRYNFSVNPRATVYGLKCAIFKSKGFEEYNSYTVNNIVLTFGWSELNDDRLLTYYGIKYGSLVKVAVKLRGGAGPEIFVLDEEKLLDPQYDYDFTNVRDDGKVYKRGSNDYKRPYGWNRIALKVKGKYPDDTWLGAGGIRTHSSPGEWTVSYHGSKKPGVEGIARTGYDENKWKRDLHGKGHYSTPNINVAARYATSFQVNGKNYQAVMQNRVNLRNSSVISKERTGAGAEYFVTPSSNDLRAYGICTRRV